MSNDHRSTAEFTYTVRISTKGGRRLGLVLVDSEEPPPKPRNLDEPEKPQTTSKIDEALRRADAELEQAWAEKKKREEAEEEEAKSPPKDVTPGSEDDAKGKDEKEKEKVSPHLVGVPVDLRSLVMCFYLQVSPNLLDPNKLKFSVAESAQRNPQGGSGTWHRVKP